MSILLLFFIAGLIASTAVWIAAYWPVKPSDVSAEVVCPLPTEGTAD